MNRILVGIGIVGVITFVIFVIRGSSIDYIATVDDEVTKLETELVEIEEAASAGTLTTGDASRAHKNIATRLNTINNSVHFSQGTELNDSQRMMLVDGLERLKNTLVTYQTTLQLVEDTAESDPGLDSDLSSADRQALTTVLDETIDMVEEYAAEVIGLPVKEVTEEDLPEESASSTESTTHETDTLNTSTTTSTSTAVDISVAGGVATTTE